ncbi:(Fe-S)-binding protein [Hydrogenimonas sp. SS33]|uniref:(Fe-S)-binding protein n=1 Tax=Hydrogenimonas leucolamina TaxID=2954236 RepID=UPI00336C0B09
MKRIGLFVPCYIDDFYPEAALSTLEILEAHGFDVAYPENQSCCGQPLFNNGLPEDARLLAERFVKLFGAFDYVVAPSSSCIATVKYRYREVLPQKEAEALGKRVYELFEFLHDVVGVERLRLPHPFPHRVGLHQSCHGLRELGLGCPSETFVKGCGDKVRRVLEKVEGIDVVMPSRDECCGFGGTFSVQEHALSARMGRDRIADHTANGVEVITGVDMSCLMHMQGLAKRDGIPLRFVHAAQILAGRAE